MIDLMIILILIFSTSFEATGGTVTYMIDSQPLVVIEGCEMKFQSISDTTAYAVDYYKFECDDSIPAPVFGTDHSSVAFINNVGIYCDIDFFELSSANHFNLRLKCD